MRSLADRLPRTSPSTEIAPASTSACILASLAIWSRPGVLILPSKRPCNFIPFSNDNSPLKLASGPIVVGKSCGLTASAIGASCTLPKTDQNRQRHPRRRRVTRNLRNEKETQIPPCPAGGAVRRRKVGNHFLNVRRGLPGLYRPISRLQPDARS